MADGSTHFAFTPAVEHATAPVWEKVSRQVTPLEWRAAGAADRRDQPAEAREERRHPGAQLHDAGDLPRRRRLRRRQPGPGPGGGAQRRRRSSSRPACTSWPRPPRCSAPTRRVLIPDLRAGCSLAASITGADVRLIKQRYPGLPVVTYVNTTAEVKAETDICCTSANAVQVVEAAARRVGRRPGDPAPRRVPGPQRRAPDRRSGSSPGRAAARCTSASTPPTSPRCARPIPTPRSWPTRNARPRCWRLADFAGSTAAMSDYVLTRKPRQVVLITECSMADNVACRRAGHRVRAALQPLPAHEADHPGEHLRGAAARPLRGHRRARRSPSAPAPRSSA